MSYINFLGKETQAYDLLEVLVSRGYEIKAPIDIEEIIKKYLDIKYEIKPDFKKMNVTGSISIVNREPYVWVNPMKNTTKERRRFTLAHELGHLMIHLLPQKDLINADAIEDINIGFNRDENWDYKEMEANNFAAQLLMPSFLIEKKLEELLASDVGGTDRDVLIERMASEFCVSRSAMEFRLNNMGV